VSDNGHLVTLADVHKSFGDNVVLDGIDLEIDRGSAVVVAGPSGSGKSTMLRCINGLEPIDAGQIRFDGSPVDSTSREIYGIRARIGMVFQQFNLFPHMTVAENITLGPLEVGSLDAKTARAQALELLERVGIPEKADDYPADLSGGQQQRVAIARALVTRPEVVFADEPTGALDTRTGRDVLDLLRGVVDRDGHTVVMVTHDPVAAAYADRVILLADGQIVGMLDAPTADVVAERLAHLGS
jgi:putative ABC transport system ATP-binding protein